VKVLHSQFSKLRRIYLDFLVHRIYGAKTNRPPADAEPSLHSGMTHDQQLVHSIKKLPSRQRTAFVMRYVQKKPLSEIAAALGIDNSDVLFLLTKALTTVRVVMGAHLDIGSPAETAHYRSTLQKVKVNQSYVSSVNVPNSGQKDANAAR
jgi:DNA-directed RNA polymerase specialized sigma24 family protein